MPRVHSLSLSSRSLPLCSSNGAISTSQFLTTSLRQAALLSRSVSSHPLKTPHTRQQHDPRIDVESLENTLNAHREYNRSRFISGRPSQNLRTHVERQRRVLSPHDPQNILQEEHSPPNRSKHNDHTLTNKRLDPRSESKPDALTAKYKDLTFQWKPTAGQHTPTARLIPWVNHYPTPVKPFDSAALHLTNEIKAFDLYASHNQQEQEAADAAIRDLKKVILDFNHHLDIHVIGSRATDTADVLSDIDVNVCLPLTPSSAKSKMDPLLVLDGLARSIQKWSYSHQGQQCPIEVVYHVKSAVVPIISCRHRSTGLPVQIQSTLQAFDSSLSVKSFLREFPTLRSLFKVLRQTLLIRGLNNGAHGGLTSYPLLNMIVASLKMSESKISPDDAGAQLLSFLDMYSDINFDTTGISTRPLGYFPKRALGKKRDSEPITASDLYHRELDGQASIRRVAKRDGHILAFQDPANPTNNLGRSATRIRDIQKTLIRLRGQLRQAMQDWDNRLVHSSEQGSDRTTTAPPNKAQSLLRPLLEADYHVYEQERKALIKAHQKLPSIFAPLATSTIALSPKDSKESFRQEARSELHSNSVIHAAGTHGTDNIFRQKSEGHGGIPNLSEELVVKWEDILAESPESTVEVDQRGSSSGKEV